MRSSSVRKRSKPYSGECEAGQDGIDGDQRISTEARKSKLRSGRIEVPPDQKQSPASANNPPQLTSYDLDQLHSKIILENFPKGVQDATNAVFSNGRRCKYTDISVHLLSWEDEGPELPVSQEIAKLRDVQVDGYGFNDDEWKIHSINRHSKLNQRILNFMEDSECKHLKIVYYVGHGRLSNHDLAVWTR